MKEKILSILKRHEDYVSGEDVSRHLGISRAAIWKHIHQLRIDGFDIIAVPHLGYRLESKPDKMLACEIAWQLNTKIIGTRIHTYETAASTMDIAFGLGVNGAAEGTVVCAEAQTKGRGRLGRHWNSPKEAGLYFSIILRPAILPTQAPKLTLLASVSICSSLRNVTGLPVTIKWPNDILIKDKKIGGILTELNAETDRIKFVVIGIGINVNTAKHNLPAGASSLKESAGKQINRVELFKEILRQIDKDYLLFKKEGFQSIIKRWREFSSTLGCRVKVLCQKEHVEGEAVDIDIDGGLLIRKDSGFVEKVMSGDVVKIR